MTTETDVRPYRVPTYTPEPEEVRLSDFDIDDIREYLERHDRGTLNGPADDIRDSGDGCSNDVLVIASDDIDRINTLALCGQLEHARAHALRLVSDHIGRQL